MSYGGWPLYPDDPEGGYDGSNPDTKCSVCGVRKIAYTKGGPGQRGEAYSGLFGHEMDVPQGKIGLFGWDKIHANAQKLGYSKRDSQGKPIVESYTKTADVCNTCLTKARGMKAVAESKTRTTIGRRKGGRASQAGRRAVSSQPRVAYQHSGGSRTSAEAAAEKTRGYVSGKPRIQTTEKVQSRTATGKAKGFTHAYLARKKNK